MQSPLKAINPLALALASAALALLAPACSTSLVNALGGASSRAPSEFPNQLSPTARKLADEVYAGVHPAKLADYHVHLVGLGDDGSGCYAHPRMREWGHPFHHIKFRIFCSASRVTDHKHAAPQYFDRLGELAKTAPGRFLILAFDEHRNSEGRVVPEKTEFHVPNDHAMKMAASAPAHFAAAGSVHPYRQDAIHELRRLHAKGVRVIKWLPNAMGINPADPKCDAFYQEMSRLDMVLLTHGGVEAAVESEEDQCLGNPQHLERPLDMGVKVIVAHCASLGKGEDHAAGPGAAPVENWKLLFRMMEEPKWKNLLFADISAITQINRTPEFLRTVLTHPDLQKRLVNGSDYPLPAINLIISLRRWTRAGLLDPADAKPLREIYQVNPLIFDFALKRRLRVLHPDGSISRFADSVFEENPALPLSGSPATSSADPI